MRKPSLTVVAVCATLLLWAGAVHAAKGGLPACQASLNLSNSNLLTCATSLTTCNSSLTTCMKFPATGQTTKNVAGDDGDIRAGAALSYTDNGDGTITDNNTKLMWEKKDQASGGLHNVFNEYPWNGTCQDGMTFCGTDADCNSVTGTPACNAGFGRPTIFQWVGQLNAAGFAGHTDWRVPNVKELQSIVDYGTFGPAVATAFNTNCSFGTACSVLTCSCTWSNLYWSATTDRHTGVAWLVDFDEGGAGPTSGAITFSVRAVRSG